jgi:hypothetical protein
MTKFFDSGKFVFEDMKPIHYRELGEKENNLYRKNVTWADVAINGVPLEKSFEYEDTISQLKESSVSVWPEESIIMNGRDYQYELPVEDDDYSLYEGGRWMNRMKKITLIPISLPEAKKKKKTKERYPVKPKAKKEVRDEKIYSSSDKFEEMTDEKDHSHLEHFITDLHHQDDYHEIISWDDGDERGYNVRKEILCQPKYKKYIPPEHWVTPTVQWEKIWSEMDQLEMGRKRDYYYVKPGETNQSGVKGPAIYFEGEDYPYGTDCPDYCSYPLVDSPSL